MKKKEKQKRRQLRAVKRLQVLRDALDDIDRILAKLQWTMRVTRKPHEIRALIKRKM